MRQVASLGDVGKTFSSSKIYAAEGWFTLNKQPTSVNATGTSNVPYAFVSLFRNAVLQDRSRCNSSGVWHFYDMDDSGTQIYTVAAYTQDGPTGELWTIAVTGSTATVTKLFDSQRAIAAAFT